MAKLWEVYADDIHDNFGNLYANWPPNAPVKLGDFGVLKGDVFVPKGNIHDTFKVPVRVRPGENYEAEFSYASADSTEVEFKARATGTNGQVTANASVEIKFSAKNAVFFQASECANDLVENEKEVGDALLRLLDRDQWDEDWVVVTRLVKAGATTIVISSASSGGIKLEAEADIPQIRLSDAALKLSVTREKSVGFKVVTAKELIPLLGFSKVRPAFWPWDDPRWGEERLTAANVVPLRNLDTLDAKTERLSDGFYFARMD